MPVAKETSTDSHVDRGIHFFASRYALVRLPMGMRIWVAVAFPVVRFRRFFRSLLGLINRSNPYVVRESYLVKGSYGENECERRSKMGKQ